MLQSNGRMHSERTRHDVERRVHVRTEDNNPQYVKRNWRNINVNWSFLQDIKAYGDINLWLHTFLNSVLDGNQWSALRRGALLASKEVRWAAEDRWTLRRGKESLASAGSRKTFPWLQFCSRRVIMFEAHSEHPSLRKWKMFAFFVATPYSRKDFPTIPPARISLRCFHSENYRIYWKKPAFLKFYSTLLFCVDEFMGLTSNLRHMWLGYTLCGCFVPTEELIKL